MRNKILLAAPYSGTPGQRERRFHALNRAAAGFIRAGYCVCPPLCPRHAICADTDLPHDHGHWKRLNAALLPWADELWVHCQEGWDNSQDIADQILQARNLDMPVKFFAP